MVLFTSTAIQSAISLIKSENFNAQKENRLIKALYSVDRWHGVAKAKEQYKDYDLAAFKQTLKELSNLGINPVTIPQKWGVKRIWNLLECCHGKISLERWEQQDILLLEEYLKNSHSKEKRTKKEKRNNPKSEIS